MIYYLFICKWIKAFDDKPARFDRIGASSTEIYEYLI